MTDVLSRRALNRATLARQLLLERARTSVADAVERLLALQAQQPSSPFLALWNRLAGFGADDLRTALDKREVVRATYVRATLHLLSARDYLAFRALVEPSLVAAAAGVTPSPVASSTTVRWTSPPSGSGCCASSRAPVTGHSGTACA
ncbi:DNA glycosylase AlkZ-like family protein [Streptomyces flaveolus]|uniref:DNA glycosylase AlkZ-like family protein n=1 Tax=Streptomyces flaveolus TaxID=67297 RepID=UPI003F53F0D4